TPRTVTLSTFSPNASDSQGNADPYGKINGLAPADINYEYFDTTKVTIRGGTGGDTFNVLATGVTTNLVAGASSTVNVGNAGGVQGILGTLNIENPPSFNAITVNDSADATGRVVTLSSFTPNASDSQGNADVYGKIAGLAPADI